MRLLFAAALLAAAPASAQDAPADTLRPGSLDFSAVPFENGSFEVRLVQPMAQAIGTVTEEYVYGEDGTLLIVSSTFIPMADQEGTDSTVVVADTFEPISRRSVSNDETVSIDFDGPVIAGTTTPTGGSPSPFDVNAEGLVFGPGSMTRIVRALPFEDGYTAAVATFDDDDGVGYGTVRVTGRRDVDTPDGTVSAWSITVRDGDTEAEFAVHPDTRDLLLMEIAPQPGVIVRFVRQ